MTHAAPQTNAVSRAVLVLGGVTAAAKKLDVPGHRYQTVQGWLKSQVPAEYCPLIERETRAAGAVVTCEQLRPDIAWSVIRGQVISALMADMPDLSVRAESAEGTNSRKAA